MRIAKYCLVFLLLIIAWNSNAKNTDDITKLKALDQAYANEWKKGNKDGILNLFFSDATLVPHHGDKPIEGLKDIENFWFNPEYPPTIVPEWVRTPQDVMVNGNVGIVRGRQKLVWEYDGSRTTIPDGNYVLIAMKIEKEWKIKLLTWNDDPRKWIVEPINPINK